MQRGQLQLHWNQGYVVDFVLHREARSKIVSLDTRTSTRQQRGGSHVSFGPGACFSRYQSRQRSLPVVFFAVTCSSGHRSCTTESSDSGRETTQLEDPHDQSVITMMFDLWKQSDKPVLNSGMNTDPADETDVSHTVSTRVQRAFELM